MVRSRRGEAAGPTPRTRERGRLDGCPRSRFTPRFTISTHDPEPAHVHVWKDGAIARIRIGDADDGPEPVDPGAMRTPDVRRAVRIVEARQEAFLAAWREYHGA